MSAQQLSEEQKAAQVKQKEKEKMEKRDKKIADKAVADERQRVANAEASEKVGDQEDVKPVDFVRRDTRPGIYTTKTLGNEIKIKDRQHYYAKTLAEIEFLDADPEVVIFDSGKKKK